MRTTLDIPDTLYRRVRSRSALEGTTLRSITITLYTDWLSRPQETAEEQADAHEGNTFPPWAGLCASSISRNTDGPHDMASIRKSIASAKRLTAV